VRHLILAFSIALLLTSSRCGMSAARDRSREYTGFRDPQRVTILGYSGEAMEPFITRDGRYLLFNNPNDPAINTNLHYARFVNGLRFQYVGEIAGVNTPSLDAVATVDRHGNLYFVSTRSYETTFSTLYHGRFVDGGVVGVELVDSISEKKPGRVTFDVEVSEDGNLLLMSDGTFTGGQVPKKADLSIAVRQGEVFQRAGETDLMENINSNALEYAAALSADGLELFFTRLRGNEPAIYRSARATAEEPFGQPERIHAAEGFVEAPTLSPDQRTLYFHKREDNRFVIYRVTR
jgi:hypothetical protein